MIYNLSVIKGIHPGLILERELKLRKIQKNKFAQLLDEHVQTIVAITKARRKMNTALALKIEHALNLEEGILMVLQAWYDIEEEKKKQSAKSPDLSKIRSILFWDTNPADINWEKQKKAVEEKAQNVLNIRSQFSDCSLADLYDPLSMPPNLKKAHQELDKAVDNCYGSKLFKNDKERIEFLFGLYEEYLNTQK